MDRRIRPRVFRRRPSVGLPLFASLALALALALAVPPAGAQVRTDDPYFLGEERRLQIVVHVFGEVDRPGEYLVPDDTDVLELVSKAGGPTEFANMGSVKLRRRDPSARGEEVRKIDLTAFLENDDAPLPPVLAPGDVVTVPRNKMAGWRTAATMVRDISVVVTTYLLYLRVTD